MNTHEHLKRTCLSATTVNEETEPEVKIYSHLK